MNLADFGLQMAGANDVIQQQQDRDYILARRQREEEQAIAAQDEARRQRAYQSELRATIPTFLSGGTNAIPAQPAVAGQQLDPRQQEGGDVPVTAQPAKPARDNEEGMLKAWEQIAIKHAQLPQYEAAKTRVKALADEGVVDFIRKARQGASESDLVDAFNKSGKIKITGLRKIDDNDYQAVTADGQPVSLNLERMTESMLGAKDLLAHLDKSEKTAAVLRGQEDKIAGKEREAALSAGLRDAKEELARSQARRADAQASGVGAGDPSARRAGNWNQFDAQVKSLATTHLTQMDDTTGKPALDRKNLVRLTSMASAMGRTNPDLSPAEALDKAIEKFDEVRRIQEGAADQAEQESGGLKFDNEKQRQQWVRGRADRLTKMRNSITEPDTASAPPAAAAGAPAAAPAAKPAARRDVAAPTTEEEVMALPSGAPYINPADGRVYYKR